MTNQDKQEMQELLPWLANDTLEGEEQAACSEYANKDLAGRRQLQQWRSLAEQMPPHRHERSGESLAWARLNKQLDRSNQSYWQQPISRGQLAASVAGIAAIGLLLVLSMGPNGTSSPGYTTLSSSSASTLAADEVALRLALEPMTEPLLEEFLNTRQATLISRSATTGVVIVSVPKGSAFSEVARWQAETPVRFAERLE